MLSQFPINRLFPVLAAVGLVIGGAAVARAEDPGPNPGVPELKVLQAFFGTWEGTVGNSDAVIKAKREWVLNSRFLKHEFTLIGGDLSGTIYRGYDTTEKEYTMVFLDSTGHASHLTGQWSEDQKMLTLEATDSAMLVQRYESYFPDPKTEKWKIEFRTENDVSEISGTAKRID